MNGTQPFVLSSSRPIPAVKLSTFQELKQSFLRFLRLTDLVSNYFIFVSENQEQLKGADSL